MQPSSLLTVNNGEHLDGILYRLKKGFKKKFRSY